MRSSHSSLANILPSSLLALILLSTPSLSLRNSSWNNNGPSNTTYDTSVRFGTGVKVHFVFNEDLAFFFLCCTRYMVKGILLVDLTFIVQENVRRVSTVCCPSSPVDNMGTVIRTMANASAHQDGVA
jgi:hypothetical protein